jgi:hypothetical protein
MKHPTENFGGGAWTESLAILHSWAVFLGEPLPCAGIARNSGLAEDFDIFV